MKTQYKRKKYDFGTQEVIVPEKGNAGDVGQSAMALGATGATLGSVAGPWGTVIGGVVGALAGTGIGLAKAGKKTQAHNQAIAGNQYLRTMDRTMNPQLQNFQAKKGLDLSKYPDGTSSIKLQPNELEQLNSLKYNPAAYKAAMWNMIGYSPKKYPAGSDGWKQQSAMYDNAVNYINDGYRPFTQERNGKKVSGYTQVYADGTSDIFTKDGVKPIEVEKDELVFSRSGKNYKLKADFKGGKTHAQGGEPFTASEGDVIYPGKHRSKIMAAYKRGDTAMLEAIRLNLPKDGNKAARGLNNDPPYEDGFTKNIPFSEDDTINLSATATKKVPYEYDANFNKTLIPISQSKYYNNNGNPTEESTTTLSAMASNPNSTSTPVVNSTPGKGANVAAGLVQAAPTIYNTIRGTFGKAQQPTKRFYTPDKYSYNDLSDPNRRLSREQYTVDKYNVGTVAGSRGQATSYLSQAGINNYKRLSDINNYEIGRKSEINNMNTQLINQAKGTNLQLANQYDDQALQNEAKRTEYLGRGMEGASALAYNRERMNNEKNRDKVLTSLAKTQHYGYEEGIGTGYYSSDGTFISGGKTYKNGKQVYSKGTKYIRTK